jgi:hypothetical protein
MSIFKETVGIRNSLLALRMKIYPTDFPFDLVEADIVKPLKTSSGNRPNTMVGY